MDSSITGCATFSLFPNSTTAELQLINVLDLVSRWQLSLTFHRIHLPVIPAGIQLVRYENQPFSDPQVRQFWTEFQHLLHQSIALEKLYKLVFECTTIKWSDRPRIHKKWPRGPVAPPVVSWFSWYCERTVSL